MMKHAAPLLLPQGTASVNRLVSRRQCGQDTRILIPHCSRSSQAGNGTQATVILLVETVEVGRVQQDEGARAPQ